MRTLKSLFPASLTAAALLGAAAYAEEDIIWPTYSQVVYPSDAMLSCDRLHAEIDHVSSDLAMLEKARDRVQEAMHTGFDLQRYRTTYQAGSPQHTGNGPGGEYVYPKARAEIIASQKVARDRRNHLENLLLFCKPT